MSHLLKALAVIGHQITKGGVAQPHRLVEHCLVEHRLVEHRLVEHRLVEHRLERPP
jgi:hypothetical protein